MGNDYDYDVVVIGGGPAGLAAACGAHQQGSRVLLIERDGDLGGILNQCIHSGFGLHYFNQELTGPEYAERFVHMVAETDIDILLNTMVLQIDQEKQVYFVNAQSGYTCVKAGAIVLAMGCRERTRGALAIPGERPSGVMTAGTAQRLINMEGYMVGKRVVILGSGDIGLIMARRMALEGAQVLACIELMPYSGGLTRNIVQCLEDYSIALYLSHTITDIYGAKRLEGVTVSQVDVNLQPIKGSEFSIPCDTLLLSVGLIPENELTRACGIVIDPRTKGAVVFDDMQTSVSGIFACGNVLHVHDLVDFVTKEAERAGKNAALYVRGERSAIRQVEITCGNGISYTVPQKWDSSRNDMPMEIYFRVKNVYQDVKILVQSGETKIASFKRRHCLPGEMEKVVIPEVLLKKIGDNSLLISITE